MKQKGEKEDGEEKEKWRERRRSDLTETDRHVACALFDSPHDVHSRGTKRKKETEERGGGRG